MSRIPSPPRLGDSSILVVTFFFRISYIWVRTSLTHGAPSFLFFRSQNRIIYAYRSRSGPGPPPGNRNPNQKPDNNATAGPSTGIMQAPGQQGQRGAPQQAQHPQSRNKRNSTSPGEEVRLITFFMGSITLH